MSVIGTLIGGGEKKRAVEEEHRKAREALLSKTQDLGAEAEAAIAEARRIIDADLRAKEAEERKAAKGAC